MHLTPRNRRSAAAAVLAGLLPQPCTEPVAQRVAEARPDPVAEPSPTHDPEPEPRRGLLPLLPLVLPTTTAAR
jgi:hypothetical protein